MTADPGGAFSPVDRSAPLEVRVLSALRSLSKTIIKKVLCVLSLLLVVVVA